MSADEFVTLPVSGPFVAVPTEQAQWWADRIRSRSAIDYQQLADLLDPEPEPPSLREQAVAAFRKAALDRDWNLEDDGEDGEIADAVLAVVADWLAAQPLAHRSNPVEGQRNHDVRLLRGQS